MNIAEKLAYAKRAIESISTHDDEDMAVRQSALNQLHNFINGEETAMHRRTQERIHELMPKSAPASSSMARSTS